VVVLGIIIIPSILGALFLLETMARAEALSLYSISRTVVTTRKGYNAITNHDPEAILDPGFQTSNWIVGTRKYEITELCEIFLGTRGMHIFSLIVAVYLYGSLWAYGTVFANSLTANFPLGEYSYYIYLVLFACCVIPTSCLELTEQVTLQMIYSACRVLMVTLMIGTVVVAYYRTGKTYVDTSLPEEEQHPNELGTNLWNWEGLHIILPVALFANIFHHSIPSLSEPVNEKKSLHFIYMITLFCCYVAYTLIGVTLALYFGDSILSSSNLNWMDYDGKITFQEMSLNYKILSVQIISSFIIVFPAVDVASAFPLCAITLGNNLFTSFSRENGSISSYDRQKVILYRLVAAIPPIIGAMFVKDLGTITDYTGKSFLSFFSKETSHLPT
jgi:amino acid permease